MTYTEKLIEEAAKAIFEATGGHLESDENGADAARAAFAVFENAHAPTESILEYGWEWASNPSTGPHLIHGSDSKESAERAMERTDSKGWPPVRIMVRTKAVPGEWREA